MEKRITNYKPFGTALTRNKHSVPLRYLVEKGNVNNKQTVLEFGYGKGTDYEYPKGLGYEVTPYLTT